jgi:hypothetical protein
MQFKISLKLSQHPTSNSCYSIVINYLENVQYRQDNVIRSKEVLKNDCELPNIVQ